MKNGIFWLCLLASLNCHADELTGSDYLLQGATNVLLVADWGQTRTIARSNGRYIEHNPFIGKTPSTGRVDRYFAVTLLAYNVAALTLPPEHSRWLTRIVGALQLGYVGHNAHMGISLDF